MAISDQLTLLNNTKQSIKASINAKGGSVTDSTTFADYSTDIDNLPSGGDNSTLIDLIERDITSINIPSGTTKIGYNAFYDCSSLTSVIMPNSITEINRAAFSRCFALSSVTLSENLTIIGENAFQNCNTLTSLVIPNSVTTIQDSAFYYCTGLTSVTLGTGLTALRGSNGNFAYCTHLTKIICLATTPPTLGSNTFTETNNCPIYVPAESVDAYKAESWISYKSRIYPIQQVATVDGNPVYNYDLLNKDATTITDVELEKMPAGTSVEFAEGLTNITAGEINYQQVTLPSTFTGFGDSNMIGSSVTTITSNAVTPPGAFRNQLGGSGLTAIYVPASAVDAYKENATWSSFASIIQAIPRPAPSVTSITFAEYERQSSPINFGEFTGSEASELLVDSFSAASDSSTFDSDIKAVGNVLVEDNNGNDITSQCTFASEDYFKWDSTQDPDYDGESEPYYEWRLTTIVEFGEEQSPHSATITATYGNLSDTFTIEWSTTSNGSPDPEEPEE